ncbi:carbonic anhydrase [Photorhabdus stackebrandtii]|uniref:Carbonic anhydrase n=1 Tax=Photorhabdus stackebrandtii TaxID=1123042 RepID=A0A7X5QMC6_9GAMM|nr:carbonic anhydrase [Photorhabdus stackebrandtii]NHB96971.1 hypothetical protein [Photorhabdus stackebrandtii]
MQDIIEGFLQFQREIFPKRCKLFKRLATSQNPRILFVACSDSHVVPELLTQREPARIDSMARENVIAQIANIKTHPSVAFALEQGHLNLHGWIYDIEAGSIDALDGLLGQFVSLADYPHVSATQSMFHHGI